MRASCNTSGADIGRRRKLGRLVDICPVVGDALLAGRISVSHALEIERIRANPRIGHFLTAVASVFVDLAEHHSFDEFHGDIAEFIALTDLDRNDGNGSDSGHVRIYDITSARPPTTIGPVGDTLPATGSHNGAMIAIGSAMTCCGIVLLARSRLHRA